MSGVAVVIAIPFLIIALFCFLHADGYDDFHWH